MSSLSEQLFQSPTGRTVIFSFIVAAFLFLLAWVIPLASLDGDPWYGFLYKDTTLPETDRFNWSLVLIESFLFTLFYLFILIFFGSLAELRNNLPSWGEVIISAIITIGFSYFLPKFTTSGTVEGTERSTGANHFTGEMQTVVFWFTILGIILMTLYVIYSGSESED
ncbi:MAG: hypothetical protein ACXAD7_10760 [Candidatus Kariarchaeaceae archaeon]|jgi:hypothetical protein